MVTLLAPSIFKQWRYSLPSLACSAAYSALRILKMTPVAAAPWMVTFWDLMLSILSSGPNPALAVMVTPESKTSLELSGNEMGLIL